MTTAQQKTREATLLEAVRELRAEPDIGFEPLLAKLREQQPGLGAEEVREALNALKAESEASKAATDQSTAEEGVTPAADHSGASLPVALSLACIGCARLPSDMDDGREKHPICGMCREDKLQICGDDCPANPDAWGLHGESRKKQRRAKANTELLDRNSDTALLLAEAQGHTAIAMLMQQHAAPPPPAENRDEEEALYAGTANRIQELSTLFEDFSAGVWTAASD